MPKNEPCTDQFNIRLRPEDKEALEQKAARAGKSLPDWARETLLGTIEFSPDYRALLAEFLAMRRLVLTHAIERPSVDQLKDLIAETESTKFRMADERIAKYLGA